METQLINRCAENMNGVLSRYEWLSLCSSSKVACSEGWVGAAADFWAFDSMRPPPQPIPSQPQPLRTRHTAFAKCSILNSYQRLSNKG